MGTDRRYLHALAATVIAGLLTYVFLGTVSRSLDDDAFDAFSVYWSVSLIIGFGLFLPVEQELSRLSASQVNPVVAGRAALRVAAEIAGGGLVLLGLTSPLVIWLGVPPEVILVSAGFVAVSAIQFAARGFLLVQGRLSYYANVLIGDSVLRVLITGLIAAGVIGVAPGAGPFIVGLMLAIAVVHLLPLLALRESAEGVREYTAGIRPAVLGLIVGALSAQLLLNAGPIIIDALGAAPGAAGAFQATFSLARVPLFILVPLQGIVVAPLAALVERGDTKRMTSLMLRIGAGVAAAMAAGGLGGYFLGPWVIELIFGAGRSLAPLGVALLIAGVMAHCGLVLGTQAMIAANRHRRASLVWVCSAVVFGAVVLIAIAPLGVVSAVIAGFLISSILGWALTLLELSALGRRASGAR